LAQANNEIVSIGYLGNVVDVWEKFDQENIHIDLGSDQTLHNPWAGGYPDISFEEANSMMAEKPELFKIKVQETLRRHTTAINKHTARNVFLRLRKCFLARSPRWIDVMEENPIIDFRYPSYVQDIMGPMCFDYGFGPFRWVCVWKTRRFSQNRCIVCQVLEEMAKTAPEEIQQMQDNIQWIKGHKKIN
jgi:urocanate hydratase